MNYTLKMVKIFSYVDISTILKIWQCNIPKTIKLNTLNGELYGINPQTCILNKRGGKDLNENFFSGNKQSYKC